MSFKSLTHMEKSAGYPEVSGERRPALLYSMRARASLPWRATMVWYVLSCHQLYESSHVVGPMCLLTIQIPICTNHI